MSLFIDKIKNEYLVINKSKDEFNLEEILYENKINKDIIIKKPVASITNNFNDEIIDLISKRINFLKQDYFMNYLYTEKEHINGSETFFNYTQDILYNLDKLTKENISYNQILSILKQLIKIGSELENNFEYHPSLIPKNIKIQKFDDDFKVYLSNPYSYANYYDSILNNYIPVLSSINLPLKPILTNGIQREKIVRDNGDEFLVSLYKFHIKNIQTNVYELVISIICLGTHTPFNEIYQNNQYINLDKKIIKFTNEFKNTVVGKFVQFILNNISNIPTFLDLNTIFENNIVNENNIDILLNEIKYKYEYSTKNKENNNLKQNLNYDRNELYPRNNNKNYYQIFGENKVNNENLNNNIISKKNILNDNISKLKNNNAEKFSNKNINRENEEIEKKSDGFILNEFNKNCNYSYDPVFYKIPYCTCSAPYNVQAYFPPAPILYYSKDGFVNPNQEKEVIKKNEIKDKIEITEDKNIWNNLISKKNKITDFSDTDRIKIPVRDDNKSIFSKKETVLNTLMNDKNDNSFIKQIASRFK